MATITIKIGGFIQKSPHSGEFQFCAADMTSYGWLMVAPYAQEITFDLPEGWNPVAAEVATLETKLAEISDEFMQQSRAIKSRIADLKCLPAPVEA